MNKKLLFLLLGSSMLSAQTINESAAATKVSGKTGINTNIPTRTLTIQNTDTNQGKPVLRLVDTPKYSEKCRFCYGCCLRRKYTEYYQAF